LTGAVAAEEVVSPAPLFEQICCTFAPNCLTSPTQPAPCRR